MTSTPKVELFVIGAPKCGTTSLAAALRQMAEFYVPHIKEPHFFCDDAPGIQRVHSLPDYESLYENSGEACGVDCSVWYLSSSVAAQRIYDYNPSAQIIVMLRDPVTMLPSLHNQLVFSGREEILKFPDAWRMSSARLRGEHIPPNAMEAKHLEYDRIADFEKQIRPWVKLFKTNLHTIFLDELIENEVFELDRLSRFLGLPSSAFNKGLPKENKSRVHRMPQLSHLLMHPPFPFSILKLAIKRWVGPVVEGRMRGLYSALSRPADKVATCPDLSAEIRSCYGPYEDLKSRVKALMVKEVANKSSPET